MSVLIHITERTRAQHELFGGEFGLTTHSKTGFGLALTQASLFAFSNCVPYVRSAQSNGGAILNAPLATLFSFEKRNKIDLLVEVQVVGLEILGGSIWTPNFP